MFSILLWLHFERVTMYDVLIVYIVYFAICFVLSCIGCVDNWRGLQNNYISEYTIAIAYVDGRRNSINNQKIPIWFKTFLHILPIGIIGRCVRYKARLILILNSNRQIKNLIRHEHCNLVLFCISLIRKIHLYTYNLMSSLTLKTNGI